jgi:hypothetical protein
MKNIETLAERSRVDRPAPALEGDVAFWRKDDNVSRPNQQTRNPAAKRRKAGFAMPRFQRNDETSFEVLLTTTCSSACLARRTNGWHVLARSVESGWRRPGPAGTRDAGAPLGPDQPLGRREARDTLSYDPR